MHNALKRLFVSAMILVVSGLIVGCGENSVSSENVKSVENEIEVSYSWWGNDPRHIYTMEALSKFAELNPEIKVKSVYGVWDGYEKRNRVRMNSKTETDVMQINYAWLTTYSSDGEGYYDLRELSDYIDFSNFSDEDLEFGEMNGKLNALPIAYNTPCLYYNKAIFDEYGLDIPETWDDLSEVAAVLGKHGIYTLGMTKKHAFLLMISYYEQTSGKRFFGENGEVLLSESELEELLDMYKKMIDEKILVPLGNFERGMLTTGEMAGAMCWISDTGNYCGSIESGGGVPVLGEYLSVKGYTGRLGWYVKPATMYAISKNTSNPEQAAKLLDFLVNSEEVALLQKDEKGIPVSKTVLNVLVENDILNGMSFDANQKMLDERERLSVMIPIMEDEAIIDVFKEQMDAYAYEKVGGAEAAHTLYENLHKKDKESE